MMALYFMDWRLFMDKVPLYGSKFDEKEKLIWYINHATQVCLGPKIDSFVIIKIPHLSSRLGSEDFIFVEAKLTKLCIIEDVRLGNISESEHIYLFMTR